MIGKTLFSRRSACRAGAGAAIAVASRAARAAGPPIPIPIPIPILAAENFYGDVARQIGGDAVRVASILNSPDQDPHLFEASPRVARAVAHARIVIYSGLGYDPWMRKLLAGAPGRDRTEIDVGALTGRKAGANPHIWYDLDTMRRLAAALEARLVRIDPGNRDGYAARRARFDASLQPIVARITALRGRLAGTVVTATEPVLGYMLQALRMRSINQGFQRAVMNNTEPSAREVAAFERSLRDHAAKLLVYNAQASDKMATRMTQLAKQSGIPVVGASETEPPGKTYQQWMQSELAAVAAALNP